MKKFLAFSDFINENEKPIFSVDTTPERIKDTRGYSTKPAKVVYKKTTSTFGTVAQKFTETQTKEKKLYMITPSTWLNLYMSANKEEIFKKGERGEYKSCSGSDFKDSELSKIGTSRDLEYVKIDQLKFKEFNIYRVDAYGLEKTSTYGVHYSLGTHEYWFITCEDALLSGNHRARTDAYSLTTPEEEKGPRESWAILIARNPYSSSDKYPTIGWARNDGHDREIDTPKEFKKRANRAADNMASKAYHEHMGGSVKIYYDKQKFIDDMKKMGGGTPNL